MAIAFNICPTCDVTSYTDPDTGYFGPDKVSANVCWACANLEW